MYYLQKISDDLFSVSPHFFNFLSKPTKFYTVYTTLSSRLGLPFSTPFTPLQSLFSSAEGGKLYCKTDGGYCRIRPLDPPLNLSAVLSRERSASVPQAATKQNRAFLEALSGTGCHCHCACSPASTLTHLCSPKNCPFQPC